jgi:hypothetical protein
MQDQPGDSQETSQTILYVGTDAGLPHRLRPLLDEQGLRLKACSDLDDLRMQCPAHECIPRPLAGRSTRTPPVPFGPGIGWRCFSVWCGVGQTRWSQTRVKVLIEGAY